MKKILFLALAAFLAFVPSQLDAKKVKFKNGDNVKIIDGPLANNQGYIDEVSADGKKARVLISMFGREMPVEVEISQIDFID